MERGLSGRTPKREDRLPHSPEMFHVKHPGDAGTDFLGGTALTMKAGSNQRSNGASLILPSEGMQAAKPFASTHPPS